MQEIISGWLKEREGKILFNLSKKCKEGVIVEIGSWKGKSTIQLAKGSKAGNQIKVYAIDPFTGSPEHHKIYGKVWTYPEFKENIKKADVEDIIFPIIKTSSEAAKSFKEKIGLLFIDGNHEYDFIKSDLLNYYPKVIEKGIIIFHDINLIGVRKVLVENVFFSKNFRKIKIIKNLAYAQKTKREAYDFQIFSLGILYLVFHYYLYKLIKKLKSLQFNKIKQ